MAINKKIFVISALFIAACSSSTEQSPKKDFRANMRDAQQISHELFSYVWKPAAFESKANEQKISGMLKELSNDFHEVQKVGAAFELEPGFNVVLSTQRELLKDISSRFNNGQKDYALWRLKGMGQNCIACHSRLNVPYDFFGDVKLDTAKNIEGEFYEAEFLFASRKFDQASERFLAIAKKSAKMEGKFDTSIHALKYWLLIEIRVKARFVDAATELNKIIESKIYNSDREQILKHWVSDLQKGSEDQEKILEKMLFIQNNIENANEVQERDYVSNIRATSALHSFLDANPISTKRKKALLNLGSAYLKIPLPSLAVFGPMYLEQTIREYPKSKEAKQAYKIYKMNLELEFTGSGGLHLDTEQNAKLNLLKKLSGS